MTALSAERPISRRAGEFFEFGVSASEKIWKGSLVVLSGGYAEGGTAATGLVAVGVATETVDNTDGGDGALSVQVQEGIFLMGNYASDLVAASNIGSACYIVDDQTVGATSDSGARSVAGYVRDVDSSGVWVEVRRTLSLTVGLTAANNLSDVAAAATARSNIGANFAVLNIAIADLAADGDHFIAMPKACTVTRAESVMFGALTGGDPTITLSNSAGTGMTSGVLTLAASGSGAGIVDTASPSANNTFAEGEKVKLTVAANSQSNNVAAQISLLITY